MYKYMVLKVLEVVDHPYEDVQPCEYNGKTVFDGVEEAKDALAQSVLDFINESGLGLKDLANMIAYDKIRFRAIPLEVGRLYINSKQNVEWRITKIEI